MLPAVDVDWCDAYAFCSWAGKRLCGKIGGGSGDDDGGANQWLHACSFGGAHVYPYGGAYSPTACNGIDFDAGALLPVGTLGTCVGGYVGLFDMSGNALEWDDTCDGPAMTDRCRLNGGSFLNTAPELRCDFVNGAPRSARFPYVGFRCCSSP